MTEQRTGPPPMPYMLPLSRPAAVKWFAAYAVFMALVYALCTAGGILIAARPDLWSDSPDPASLSDARIEGIVFAAIGGPLLLGFAAGPLLPRRKWAWVYHIVLIAVGFTSMCCWPATIPLLIFYIRPEVKEWFDGAA